MPVLLYGVFHGMQIFFAGFASVFTPVVKFDFCGFYHNIPAYTNEPRTQTRIVTHVTKIENGVATSYTQDPADCEAGMRSLYALLVILGYIAFGGLYLAMVMIVGLFQGISYPLVACLYLPPSEEPSNVSTV